MIRAKKSVNSKLSKVGKSSAGRKNMKKSSNPQLAKLEKKAQKLRKHIKIAKEDKQSIVRLKQIENQIAS